MVRPAGNRIPRLMEIPPASRGQESLSEYPPRRSRELWSLDPSNLP